MSLNESFRKRYSDALKKCLMTVEMSDKYEALSKDYDELRERINGELKKRDSVCSDVERLIDKSTGKLKANFEIIIDSDTKLLKLIKEFRELWLKKQSFVEFGWQDGLMNHIDSVLAIAEYSELEKEIIAKLGLDEGQHFIYEAKCEILEFEKSLGVDFFREEVLKMRDLFKIKALVSKNSEILVSKKDNLKAQKIILSNSNGEDFSCEKSAQITHNGEIIIEIELQEDLRVGKFNYYVLHIDKNCQKLTLIEDKELIKVLDAKREKLEISE